MTNSQDSASKLHKLLLDGRRYSIAKKQIIQSTEDRQVVNIIIKGFVRKYWVTNDGSIGVVIVYGPGDVFPVTLVYKRFFNQVLYSGLETYFYEAMSETEVRSVDAETLVAAVREDSDLYTDLFQEAGRHLEYCIHALENGSLRNSEKKTAHLLLYFAKKFGVKKGNEVRIDLPLSHQDIGDVISVTRETVTNAMKSLRSKGLILPSRHIIVPDIKKLEQEVYN